MASTFRQDLQRQRIRLIDPLGRALANFWSWWSTELVATLPAATREAIASANTRVLVSPHNGEWIFQEGNGTGTETIARLPTGATRRPEALPGTIHELVLKLPAEKVLRRNLTLPLAAEENLREVLGFEMDRQTPFAVQQVYYDYQVTGRLTETNTITLELLVSPKATVDEFCAAMQRFGAPPDTITAADDSGSILPVNLLPPPMRPARALSAPRLNSLLATVSVLLLIGVLSLPHWLNKNKLELLDEEISIAETRGQSGLELQRDVERILRTSEFLTQKKRDSVLLLRILDEVTRVLPDNTWLIQFDFSAPEIQLQGQSASAADLIQLLESSPLFKDARFRSPVVQIPRTDLERFHLSVQLDSGEAR